MNNNSLDAILVYTPGFELSVAVDSPFTHNLGLGYLSAYVNSKGFNTELYARGKGANLDGHVRGILASNPKVVGFYVLNSNYLQSLLVASRIKELDSEIIIVFGGPTPTVEAGYVLENTGFVDVCVRGEGEEVFCDLLSAFSAVDFNFSRAILDGINGVSYKIDGRIFTNPSADILLAHRKEPNYLDNYPSPYLNGLIPVSAVHQAGLITARGCNQHCVFCNCAILHKNRVFTHSEERVLEELCYLNRHKSQLRGSVPIQDDAFTLFPKRAEKICRGMIENKIDLHIVCQTRCDRLTEGLLDLMKEARIRTLWMSLESGVPRILRTIGKVHRAEDQPTDNLEKETLYLEQLRTMASYAKKIGLDVGVSIMVGLPGETAMEARKTMDFLQNMEYDSYIHNEFQIYTGTPIHQKYRQYGYKLIRYSKNQIHPLTIAPKPIKKEELNLARKSDLEQDDHKFNDDTLETFAMRTKRSGREPFFSRLIIFSDQLHESMALWIRKNVVFGAQIIQVYSSLDALWKSYKLNLKIFHDFLLPTKAPVCYYIDQREGHNLTLKPWMSRFRSDIGLFQVSRACGGTNDDEGISQVGNLIGVERTKEDSEYLPELFDKFSKREDFAEQLLENAPLPLVSTLCKWRKAGGNCQVWEIAIIDKYENIRLCWSKDPIGKIPAPIEDLIEEWDKQNSKRQRTLDCEHCAAVDNCVKCGLPAPLSQEEYCRFKLNGDFSKSANQLNRVYDLGPELALMRKFLDKG